MGLPKQVRQQIAEAKRIEDELKAAQAAPPPAQPTLVKPAEPPVAAAPAPVPAPQPEAQYQELLQQYRSLQGIHRTLVRSNSELQSQLQSMQTQVNELTAHAEQVRNAPPPSNPVTPISEAEIKEFGPDLINVIERKAREVAAPLNAALEQANVNMTHMQRRNAELETQLKSVSADQAQTRQSRFESDLVQLVPDFNALNYDNTFLSWLSQVDPLDAHKRTLQERLNEAVSMLDAQAAASYFNAYKKLAAFHAARPKNDISGQAQPASRSAPDVVTQNTGRQWSQGEISQFYSDVARGKVSPQEKARIEGEIFKAQKENRIAA
jgi:DNA repair exonuclease SbcCD ATPase subunit